MSKAKVYVTRKIPERGLEILAQECDVLVNPEDRSLSKEEIIKNIKEVQGVLSMLSDPIDREVIASNSELKVISNYAVGYNNIDLEAATEHGVAVTNTPGVLTDATADLAWALLMAVARRVVESDSFTREGKFKGWAPRLLRGLDVYGKTIGIIGFGRIGQAVARRAHGFNMKVFYNKRTPLSREEEDILNVKYADLEQLLKESDFISINAPLNDSTMHLFGREEFKKMKKTAVIINTGRGPIIDEVALLEALRNSEIAGAGLDVYEKEPVIQSGLLELANVVLTPHTGSATYETRDKMAEMAARDLLAGIKGEDIVNLVNPQVRK